MSFKLWVVAATALVLLGLALLVGSLYVPRSDSTLHVEFLENSCAIRCPPDSTHSAEQASVTCTAGSAPLCQCTNPHQPAARCVPAQ